MRKAIIIILVLGAAGIYTWDVLLLVKSSGDRAETAAINRKREAISIDRLLAQAEPVRFVEKGRDPFSPRQKAVAAVQTVKGSAAGKTEEKAPVVTITGIMWNASSPLAMITLPDGSSTVAKEGQSFGDITVKKIERTRVQIVYNKKTYWINQ